MVKPGSDRRSARATAALLSLLLLSCSRTSAAQQEPKNVLSLSPLATSKISSRGCDHATPVPPGTARMDTIPSVPAKSEGRRTRSYRVHVPIGYSSNQLLPVILVFHGHGGSPLDMERTSGFSTLADQKYFIAVYPQGLPFGAGVARRL